MHTTYEVGGPFAVKDYYKKFLEICMRSCTDFGELVDKKTRERHNRAMTSCHKLQLELFKLEDKGSSVVLKLLEHEDERVQLSAGAYCIHAQIHVPFAIEKMKHIEATSKYCMMRVVARMTIECCEPWDKTVDPEGSGGPVP